MLEAHEIVTSGTADARLELPFELRKKSRLRAELENGETIGLFLPRGTVLRHGTMLRSTEGRIIVVCAAPEDVSTVHSSDTHLLTRVAYHLGNRHVPLQVERDFLRYQHDHVLDDMVRGLGADVHFEQAPFEPEAGAYGGGHRHDSGDHDDPTHDHDHPHDHAHGHGHGHGHGYGSSRERSREENKP